MITSEAIGALFGETIGVIIGCLILYASLRKDIHPWMRVWWLPKDIEGRDSVDCFVGGIAGGGLVLVGLMMLVGGILTLLQ